MRQLSGMAIAGGDLTSLGMSTLEDLGFEMSERLLEENRWCPEGKNHSA